MKTRFLQIIVVAALMVALDANLDQPTSNQELWIGPEPFITTTA